MKFEAIIELSVPIELLSQLNERAKKTGVTVQEEVLRILNELVEDKINRSTDTT